MTIVIMLTEDDHAITMKIVMLLVVIMIMTDS